MCVQIFHISTLIYLQSYDFGKGFDLPTTYKTGWFAIIGAAVVAAAMTQL